MDKKEYYQNCEKCGRPMVYAKPCECKYDNSCLSEYRCPMPACIKNKQPDCLAKAVIPAITVDTVEGITNLANCFVHIANINTTIYVDDKHRPMIIWAGPVEVVDYDIAENELNLRSQFCFTKVNGEYTEVYFDRRGIAHVMATEVA